MFLYDVDCRFWQFHQIALSKIYHLNTYIFVQKEIHKNIYIRVERL